MEEKALSSSLNALYMNKVGNNCNKALYAFGLVDLNLETMTIRILRSQEGASRKSA